MQAIIKAHERHTAALQNVLMAFRNVHAACMLELIMLGVDGNKLYTFYTNDHISDLVRSAQDDYVRCLKELDDAEDALNKIKTQGT